MKGAVLIGLFAGFLYADGIPQICPDSKPKAKFSTRVLHLRSVRLNGVLLDSVGRNAIKSILINVPAAPDAVRPFAVMDGAKIQDESLDQAGRLSSFNLVEPIHARPFPFSRILIP